MLDIFNKKKLAQKDATIYRLKQDLDSAYTENAKLKATISGERVCAGHCEFCKHGYAKKERTWIGLDRREYTSWNCKLDIKCKDFVEQKDN